MIISASVVLYNTPEQLLGRVIGCCVDCKLINTLFIIDNSPSKTTFNFDRYPFITYIKTNKNIGYGSAHNIALSKILNKSDYHFVLNPDVFFSPESMGLIIKRMELEGNVGQLLPRVCNPDGTLQYLCKLLPNPADLFLRRFFNKIKLTKNFDLRSSGYNQEMNVPFLSGCFMALRVLALREVGLFDERYFMYAEDIDLTRRIHKKFTTLYYPGATIVHEHAKESFKSFKMLIIHIVNVVRYFNKWGWFFDSDRCTINKRTLSSIKNNSKYFFDI